MLYYICKSDAGERESEINMKITRIIRERYLNYIEDEAVRNGHAEEYGHGGCSIELYDFGYEAEGTADEVAAIVRYYYKYAGYGVIQDEFRKENTIKVNHKEKMITICEE